MQKITPGFYTVTFIDYVNTESRRAYVKKQSFDDYYDLYYINNKGHAFLLKNNKIVKSTIFDANTFDKLNKNGLIEIHRIGAENIPISYIKKLMGPQIKNPKKRSTTELKKKKLRKNCWK